MTKMNEPNNMLSFHWIAPACAVVLLLQVLYKACVEAYKIRLYAIEEYGRIIHEFDPYFNYRATEYLYEHGWKAFCQWFDYMVWYPLGRPVGTTIFPGMQVISVAIKNFILNDWSINDICCFVPAWFGVTATLSVFWLTYECTRSTALYRSLLGDIPLVNQIYKYLILPVIDLILKLLKKTTGSSWGLEKAPVSSITPLACAVSAAWIMSIVPAHLLRSIGGGYDNESVAMTAMVLTFACWVRALRDHQSDLSILVWGAITGLSYMFMAASWGGYVFVLNMVGVHATVLVLLGRYSTKLHRAYSMFYLVGTALAIQIPVVGLAPIKSIEQMGPLIAFGGMQLIEICEIAKRRHGNMTKMQVWKLRVQIFASAAVAAVLVAFLLLPTGYFGPISSRVRGLFVEHTKTGNPLVDSVAEHQPASAQAYFQYLHDVCYLAPVGFAVTLLFYMNDSSSFLLVYGFAAYFFSHKMVRLILLTAPIASATAGIAVGRFVGWAFGSLGPPADIWTFLTKEESKAKVEEPQASSKPAKSEAKKGHKMSGKNGDKVGKVQAEAVVSKSEPIAVRGIRMLVAAAVAFRSIAYVQDFWDISHEMAKQISHPTIIQKAMTKDGQTVTIMDYLDAYKWLRDPSHTPEDARICAWWDYGYQITGIANRTTIADGNTWNHEHIALLGRTLTAPEKEAHRILRHLADYVLVWAGGGGDDLAKSPHLRRIANSVYHGLCKEPTCRDFGVYSNRTPTEKMKESLLFKLVKNQLSPGVEVDRNRFKEVYRSKYGKVRIYKILSVSKESKAWAADPANRICDAPGSWFCRGQYPPALQKVLKEKRDFKQLEDFNYKGEGEDSELHDKYQKEYMENLLKKSKRAAPEERDDSDEERERDAHGTQMLDESGNVKLPKLSPVEIDMINEDWENNEMTTLLWELISQNRIQELLQVLYDTPQLAHVRSEDGRGPMWWAHEYGRSNMVTILKQIGVSEERKDASDITPLDISKV